jgi:hypothetical protein
MMSLISLPAPPVYKFRTYGEDRKKWLVTCNLIKTRTDELFRYYNNNNLSWEMVHLVDRGRIRAGVSDARSLLWDTLAIVMVTILLCILFRPALYSSSMLLL